MAEAIKNQTQLMQAALQGTGNEQGEMTTVDASNTTFHRGPLSAVGSGVINYQTKHGRKHHEIATSSLMDKEKFDVEPDKFTTFMHKLAAKAKDLGFMSTDGLAMVPENINDPNSGKLNIFEDYGACSYDQIKAYETSFLANQERRSQDSKVLFDLLMNSISTSGLARIAIWKEQYILGINGQEYESGGCLLKVIVRESYLDSNATVSSIRLELSSLDKYVEKNGSDIVEFNAHVRRLLDGLHARKAQTLDLLVNLFKGYKACKDAKFLDYVTQIENSHEDGTAEITPTSLMNRASNYYKKRMIAVNASEIWEGQDPTNEKIQMMEAQLEKLKASKKKVAFDKDDKKPKASPHGKPSWLTKDTPPADPKQTKTWKDKTWHWCHRSSGGKCDGKWRLHKPDECKGLTYHKDLGEKRTKKAKGKSSKSKKERMDAAKKIIAAQELLMQNLQEEEDSDSEATSDDE
jgi:hypothetical protein